MRPSTDILAPLFVAAMFPCAVVAQQRSGCAEVDTQTGMSICGAAHATQADGAMTATYNSLRKRLGASGRSMTHGSLLRVGAVAAISYWRDENTTTWRREPQYGLRHRWLADIGKTHVVRV